MNIFELHYTSFRNKHSVKSVKLVDGLHMMKKTLVFFFIICN